MLLKSPWSAMRYLLLPVCLLVWGAPPVAEACGKLGIVLHAKYEPGGTCTEPGLPDCGDFEPATSVPGNYAFELYILAKDVPPGGLAGLLTSFAWPSDWSWDAASNTLCDSLAVFTFSPRNPGGPYDGAWAYLGDCLQGWLVVIGHATVTSGASGCLTQVNPAQGPQVIEIMNCAFNSTIIDASTESGQRRLGSICVLAEGNNVDCYRVPAVEPSTWGTIKATYR